MCRAGKCVHDWLKGNFYYHQPASYGWPSTTQRHWLQYCLNLYKFWVFSTFINKGWFQTVQLVNFGVYGVQYEYQLRLLLSSCSEWSECVVYFKTISVFFLCCWGAICSPFIYAYCWIAVRINRWVYIIYIRLRT